MGTRTALTFTAVLLASLVPAAASCATGGDAGGLTVELATRPRPAVVGVPLLLRVTLVNDGADDLAVDLGPHREGAFSLSYHGSAGEVVAGEWALREGVAPPSRAPVPAGGSFVQELIVDRWLTIDRPASGTLVVALDAAVIQGGSEPFFVDGREAGRLRLRRELPVEVLADAAGAKEFCAILATEAQTGAPADVLPQLAALSLVRAPSCLPELKRAALGAAAAPHLVLDGIANVGGRGAAQTLLEILVGADAELRPHLLRHLRRFCPQHADLVSPALHAAGQGECP